jgi:cell division protein FtsB
MAMRTLHPAARCVLIALSLVLLAMPAYSQGMSRGGKGGKQQNDQQTAQRKKDAEALDKAYRAGLDKIPDAGKKQDPWQNIRDPSGQKPKQ